MRFLHEKEDEKHTVTTEAETVAVVVVPDAEATVASAGDEAFSRVVEHQAGHSRVSVRVVELEHAAASFQVPHTDQLQN